MTYIIKTRVSKIERRSRTVSSRKEGNDVATVEEDLGWFVLLEGSHEMLFVGFEKPELSAGQRVIIRLTGE